MTRTVAALTFCLTLLSPAGGPAAERAQAGATTPPTQWQACDFLDAGGACRSAPSLVPALTCTACQTQVKVRSTLDQIASGLQRAVCELSRHMPLVSEWAACEASPSAGAVAHR